MSLYNRIATASLLSGQYDDGLTTFYNVAVGASPNHIQHAGGIGRTGVRFETSASGLTFPVKSVMINFRKYGFPTGNITINIRKASDDTVAATIGTFPIESFPANVEQTLVLRNRLNNTYQMVANDMVSIEFPSNAVNGFEISTNSSASDPSGYTSRSHNGTVWSSALADPLAITIKT
jgi:hypothetical protein